MQVFFRVDSAYNIGTGHVMRCLSLADGLVAHNHPKPIFICKNFPGNLTKLVKQRGYQVKLIPHATEPTLDTKTWLGGPWEADAKATSEILRTPTPTPTTWLIIDHYDIHLNWEQEMKRLHPKVSLMSIDDYLDRQHEVRILLNQMYFQNLTEIARAYDTLMLEKDYQLLIGTRYCLLNPKILKYRDLVRTQSRTPTQSRTKYKVVISLGGCDPENVTLKVLQNLPPTTTQVQVEYHVIIGISNQHRASLEAEIEALTSHCIILHQGLSQEEMFGMLSESILVIGSIGVSMYERLCMGIPTMIITIAENQQEIANELSRAQLVDDLGFGLDFDVNEMCQRLTQYLGNPEQLGRKREEYMGVCDGRGISRIIKVMESVIGPQEQKKMKTKIGCVIQARMTSTRLPGKVLMPVYKKMSMLEVVLYRLRKSQKLDEIIVATTVNQTDDPIVELCEKLKIKTFRGSEDNVLERYYQCAKQYHLDTVVRVTSDCPLIDPKVLDEVIVCYEQNQDTCNYVSNILERTYPRGLDTEVFSYQVLEQVYQTATLPAELEHVTAKIVRASPESKEYRKYAYKSPDGRDESGKRLTVDMPEDLRLIREIYRGLDGPDICLDDVLDYLGQHEGLLEINRDIEQKKV